MKGKVRDKMLSVSAEVKRLLYEDKKYINSDGKLFARMVSDKVGGMAVTKSMTVYDLLMDIINHGGEKWVNYDYVLRQIRHYKRIHPELRDADWERRVGEDTEEAIETLNEITINSFKEVIPQVQKNLFS